MSRTIHVKEYTKADGTVVKAHTRVIDDVITSIENGDHKGTLDLINELLPNIADKKNELAKIIADGVEPENHNEIMQSLQDLQAFASKAEKYRQLSNNNLDTTQTENDILTQLKGQVTGGAAPSNNKNNIPYNKGFNELGQDEKNLIKNIERTQFFYPTVGMQIQNGISDISASRNDKDAYVFESINEIKDSNLKNELIKIGVTKEHKGCLLKEDSKHAKYMSNSSEVKNFFKKNKEDIKSGKMTRGMITFPLYNPNLGGSFHNVTLTNLKYKNGVGTADLIDLADYKHEERIKPNQINFKTLPEDLLNNAVTNMKNRVIDANNTAYSMQQKGVMKPVFYVIKIKFEEKNNE